MDNNEIFFEDDRILIINDSVFQTNRISPGSVDLVVTSPPYNVDIKYNSNDDKLSYDGYKEFSEKWMRRCYEWLKEDGRFCLNIPLDKNKGGQQSVGADLTTIAKKIGFNYHSTIIWNEGNISRRTAWGSWQSASAPYVIAPVELIVVLYKHTWKKTSGSQKSDISKRDFMDWTNGLWTFNGESKKKIGHPAPFPVELPHRCIQLFSFVGDTVLDPFLGSGTTLVASYLNNRKGIGIDIDPQYCKIALDRIKREGGMGQTSIMQYLSKSANMKIKNPKSRSSLSDLIMAFFRENSQKDINYLEVKQWLNDNHADISTKYFDRSVRTLVSKDKLIRINKGIFRYNSRNKI